MAPGKVSTDYTPSSQARQLGMALRTRRKELGINMTAAAEAAGMSRVTWHRLEKGEPRVAWGSLLAAAMVLGMELRLTGGDEGDTRAPAPAEESLPLRIRLADFPGLRRLAWQVGEGVDTLTLREAFGLYARNARHLDTESLSAREQALLRAMREAFGEAVAGV